MKRRIRFHIRGDYEGVSVCDFLARRFPYHTRAEWCAKAEAGQIHVNESPAATERPLTAGDLVEYTAFDTPEPEVQTTIGVVFDDDDLLVVDKPPNLPVHPGGRYFNHTLWAMIKERYGIDSPTLVNRLDRETSGLVIVARNPTAAKRCRAQFAGRHVQKHYLVLVEGRFPDTLAATGYLLADPASVVRKKRTFRPVPAAERETSPTPEGGEWAETWFRRLACHGVVSEVEAIPSTGRLHQIRATLQALGYPVVGDKLYGPDAAIFVRFCNGALTDEDRERLRLDRQALHAAELRFRHPRTGAPLQLVAPLPRDMADLIERLQHQSRPPDAAGGG